MQREYVRKRKESDFRHNPMNQNSINIFEACGNGIRSILTYEIYVNVRQCSRLRKIVTVYANV